MAVTGLTTPATYMAAYSPIPLKYYSDNFDILNFKYLTSIEYAKKTVATITNQPYDNTSYTLITYATAHEYNLGDTILLVDPDDDYTGFYNIVNVPNTLSIIINLTMGVTITSYPTTSKFISYKTSPDLNYQTRLDLSNTIKDFVEPTLEDTNEIYDGSSTKFNYNVLYGEEKPFIFEFYDNSASGGYVLFHEPTLPSSYITDTLPFRVGDYISIQQDTFEWEFEAIEEQDNTGRLGLVNTSGTNSPHVAGQTITIGNLSSTYDYLNGLTTIAEVTTSQYASPGSQMFVVYKDANLPSPSVATGGKTFGVPKPEYNTVAKILDIYWDVTLGVVIKTDIRWTSGTPPIGGFIVLANNATQPYPKEDSLNGLYAYNAKINKSDYTKTFFDKYIIKTRSAASNNISTILEGATKWRIEKETKCWLLVHQDDNDAFGGLYKFYNASGSLLCRSYITKGSNGLDWYIPAGINQVLANTVRTDAVAALSAVTDNIDYYTVEISNSGATVQTNPIYFEVNDDCSRYDMYHILWEDSRGSWLSYPFKYIGKEMTEYDRKTYYQNEDIWNDDDTYSLDTKVGGETGFFSRSRDKWELTSGWIEDVENDLIKDMLGSNNTYIQKPDGELVRGVIDNKEFEFFKKNNVDIYNYKLMFRASFDERRY